MKNCIALSLAYILPALSGFAQDPPGVQVSIGWNAPEFDEDGNPLNDLAGYRVYYGNQSRQYTVSRNVGNQTRATISPLDPHAAYYFAVTAYDSSGNESSYSQELAWAFDLDTDGLPDSWERTYFGTTAAADGGPNADYDRDGLSNLAEFIAETDPANAGSGPAVVTSCLSNGILTFQSPLDPADYSFAVEWAPTAGGPWYDSWDGLNPIAVTGDIIHAPIPRYFRVVSTPRASAPTE